MKIRNIHIAFFLTLFLARVTHLSAQKACFTANITRGCAPLTVNVLDCSNTPNPTLIAYKYSETEGFVTRTSNIYTTPGIYSITQIVQVGTSGDSLRRENYIEVLPSPPPQISISQCANRAISLQITDVTYEQYVINWGDGSALQVVPRGSPSLSHTYPSTAPFSVTVSGRYVPGNCGGSNSILVNPLLNIPLPDIQTIETQTISPTNGVIALTLVSDPNFQYEFYRVGNPTPIALVQGIDGTLTQTFENLNTQAQSFCYNVKVIDACGNSVESGGFYCSLSLNTTAQDSQNQIQWTSYPTANLPPNLFQQYVLFRNAQPIRTFSLINENQYVDKEVKCTENYCYQIVAEFNNPSVQFRSTSNTACVTSFSSIIPPIIAQLNSTVETERSIRLFWNVPNEPLITEYRIIRQNQSFITGSNDRQELIDTDLAIDRQFCYQIGYKNECGNSAPVSLRTCPVFLSAQAIEAGRVRLSWTPYQNAEGKREAYIVEKLDEQGNVYASVSLSTVLNFYLDTDAKTDRQILRYRIRTIIDGQDQVFSYSNIVEVRQKFKIFFPNAFTPNQDGRNDVFKPTYLFVKSYKMVIYNRLGEQMFSTEEIENGWDGTFKGKIAPQDAYIYVVELEDFLGEKFSTKGTFTLLR